MDEKYLDEKFIYDLELLDGMAIRGVMLDSQDDTGLTFVTINCAHGRVDWADILVATPIKELP